MKDSKRRQIDASTDAFAFATGGNATFTLVSKRTGTRFTFKLTKPKHARPDAEGPPPLFVKVLTGPDNASSYTFVGTLFRGGVGGGIRYAHSKRTNVAKTAPSVVALRWFVAKFLDPIATEHKDADDLVEAAAGAVAAFEQLEFWHEGRCGMCGRALTVPASIASGVGPVCAAR
jgi:hypothetical protein